jgi:hypothetical protein
MRRRRIFFPLPADGCARSSNLALNAENYFRAPAAKDSRKAIGRVCAAREEGARTDADPFSTHPAALEKMSRRDSGNRGDFHLVRRAGKAVLDCHGGTQEADLSARIHKAAPEGGEWRVCGYP